MKSVLISIQPKWCEKICHQIGEENGKPVYGKRIEVRKSKSSCEAPFKCYIYVTKGKPYLYRVDDDNNFELTNTLRPKTYEYVKDYNAQNGKIIGYFVCDKIDIYYYGNMDYPIPKFEGDDSVCEVGDGYYITSGELEETCLTYEELEDYGKGKTLYGWHISDLVIYDKPRELSEFYKCGAESFEELSDTEDLCSYCSRTGFCEGRWCDEAYQNYLDVDFALTHAPQSWCYVEEV